MGDDERPAGLDAGGVDRLDRQYALIPLRLALQSTMDPDRWKTVGTHVEDMRSALARGDVDAFRAASAALALTSHRRTTGPAATGVGDPPTGPVPEPIRERINELIHTLGRPGNR